MISIMVPAYNEESYLLNTVNIIVEVAQKINIKFEIIIVNDGSIDRTADIIKELEKKYKFICSITNKHNLGLGRSLNKVIKIAKGDKFLIVAGDGDISSDDLFNLFKNMNKAEMIFLYFLNRELRGRFRSIISMIYNTIHLLVFNVYVQYISGPCIYPMVKLRKLSIKSKHISYVAEISIKLLLSGCTYHEISGYMQRGKEGSSTISIKNFFDVIISFIRLLIDIKIINKKLYSKKFKRLQ